MPARRATPVTAAAVRRDLLERLGSTVLAWSLTGRQVGFATGFDSGLQVGGFAEVLTRDGVRHLMQIHELQVREREALRVEIDTDVLGAAANAALTNAEAHMWARAVVGNGQVLATVADEGLVDPVAGGFDEATVGPARATDVLALVRRGLGSSVGLDIGTIDAVDAPAMLKASGFSRHTFMVGQSGSGKTYSLGVLLERLLAHTTLPFIVIDPNSDHIHLGRLRDRAQIAPRGGAPIPVRAHRELKALLQQAGDVVVASNRPGDIPLRIHLSDLSLHEQALTLGLDPLADRREYAAFIDVVEELADRSHYAFDAVVDALGRRRDPASSDLLERVRNLRVAEWSVWAAADEVSVVDRVRGARGIILDTGSLEGSRERSLVSLALLGRLKRRPTKESVLVVVDEAHNVLMPDPADALQRAIVDYGVWVAGEGRKYGIHLVVSTQRPQKIHRNVISQCDNLVLMRMNSVADIDELTEIFSHVPAALIADARNFAQGEMVVAGPVATPPMRARAGVRWCPEGGGDLPTTWATARK